MRRAGENSAINVHDVGMSAPTARPTMTKPTSSPGRLGEKMMNSVPNAYTSRSHW